MRNTLALGAIILGALLVYSGYKGWTVADTIRFFTGQELKDPGSGDDKEADDGGSGLGMPGFDDDGNLELPGTDDIPIPNVPGLPQIPRIPGFEIPNPFNDVIPGTPTPAA